MGLIRAIATIGAVVCSACTDPNQTAIANACTHASAANGPTTASISGQCECVALAAKKYLDKEDFALLARVSSIYMSNEDDETKLHAMTNELMDSGVTPTRAALAAMDFVFLAHKIDGECRR